MANISNAFGKLTITTDTKETLYNFLLLHKEFTILNLIQTKTQKMN